MNLSDPLTSLIPSLDGPVLRVLAGTTLPLNAALIARISGAGSESGVRLVLDRLVKHGLVLRQRVGRSSYVAANRDHLLWPAIEIALSAREQLESDIRSEVDTWRVPPLSTTLYGSVATGRADIDSDVDLLIVTDLDEPPTSELATMIERRTGNRCHLLVLTLAQLREEAEASPALAAAWMRDGRRVQGAPVRDLLRTAG